MNKKIDDFFDGIYGIFFWIFLFLGFKDWRFFIPCGIILIVMLIKCYLKFKK